MAERTLENPPDIGNSLLNKPWAKEKPKKELEIFLIEWKWKYNMSKFWLSRRKGRQKLISWMKEAKLLQILQILKG